MVDGHRVQAQGTIKQRSELDSAAETAASTPLRGKLRRGRGSVLLFQVIDVNAICFGERRAFDKENIFGVELRAPREVIRAGDDGVINDQDLVMHEIVAAARRVGS